MTTQPSLVIPCASCGQANRVPIARLADSAKCGKCHAEVRRPGAPLDVDDELLQTIVAAAEVPVLVDFWAPWCGPCRVMAPEVEKVAASMAGKLLALKLNTDQYQQSAMRHQARSIPLLVLFHRGHEIWRDVGARGAAQLQKQIASALYDAAQ